MNPIEPVEPIEPVRQIKPLKPEGQEQSNLFGASKGKKFPEEYRIPHPKPLSEAATKLSSTHAEILSEDEVAEFLLKKVRHFEEAIDTLGKRMPSPTQKDALLELALIKARAEASIEPGKQVASTLGAIVDLVQSYPDPMAWGVATLLGDQHPDLSNIALFSYSVEHTVGVGVQFLATLQEGYQLVVKEKAIAHLEKSIHKIPKESADRVLLEKWIDKEKKIFLIEKGNYFKKLFVDISDYAENISTTWSLIPLSAQALGIGYFVNFLRLGKKADELNQQEISLRLLKEWGEKGEEIYFKKSPLHLPKKPSPEKSDSAYQVTKNALLSLAAVKKQEVVANQKIRLQKGRFEFAIFFLAVFLEVVLKTFAIVGLSVSALALLPWLQIAMLGLSIIGLAVGIVYLYGNRPELFKELLNLTHIKIIMNKIALSWNDFMLKRKMAEIYATDERMHKIHLLKEYEGYQSRIRHLQEKIGDLEKRLENAAVLDLIPGVSGLQHALFEVCENIDKNYGSYKQMLADLFGVSMDMRLSKKEIIDALLRFLGSFETEFNKRYIPQAKEVR